MRSISANFGPSGIFSGFFLGPGWVLGCLGSPNILSYMGDVANEQVMLTLLLTAMVILLLMEIVMVVK